MKFTYVKSSGLVTVAHTCNLSYLGGGEKEDCGLWPTQDAPPPITKEEIRL
jgi:hypothetical protein